MNLQLFTLYRFYHNRIVGLTRFAILCIFIVVLLFDSLELFNIQVWAFFFGLFLINETFIHFKVNRLTPAHKITANTREFLPTMLPLAQLVYESAHDSYDIVFEMRKRPEVRQLTQKMGPNFKFPSVPFPKEQLVEFAGKLVQQTGGKYITPLDCVAAYLFSIEDQTQILQKEDVSKKNFISLYVWLRNHYQSDMYHPYTIHFSGAGAFDFFVYGWDSQIKQFADNFTYQSLANRYTPIILGREDAYQQLLSALSKAHGNNVILVGDEGTGKTALVEYFAVSSHNAVIPARLNRVMVYELLVDRLLAGVQNQGQLQERLVATIDEIAHSGNELLLIQNIENIFGGGGFEFDLSGILFEYLKKGAIQVIGTTTPSAYATYLDGKQTVANLFEMIEIEEPEEEEVVYMILQRLGEIEHFHQVSVDFSAVQQSVKLAKTYSPQKKLPGSAFDLLENAIAQALATGDRVVDGKDVIAFVQTKTHILLDEPTQDEKKILLNLEEEIHKRMIDQEEAVVSVATALRRLRSGFTDEKRPISVFLFLGPTGVGKTEMAKALASIYFGSDDNMIRLDMSEFKTTESLHRILGELPGQAYIAETLVEQIQKNPFSVVLLDEFEKAHPEILDIFLQVFDEGHLTSNKGEEISFNHAIIIATSNAGSEFIRESLQTAPDNAKLHDALIEYLLQSQIFKPELINRFDDVVVFRPLTQIHVMQIAGLILADNLKKLEEKDVYITADERVLQKVAVEGYQEQFGARNIRRYIQNAVESFISNRLLQDIIVKNKKYVLSVDQQNQFVLLETA